MAREPNNLLDAIATMQIVGMVNRFMLPFAMAGRIPTDEAIERELERVAATGAERDEIDLFASLCLQMRAEAESLRAGHEAGRA